MGGQKSSDVKILWDKGHQCHEGSAGHVHLERSLDAKCERLVTQAPPSDPSPSSGRCGERPVITTRFCALFYALLPSIFGIVRVTCVRCDVPSQLLTAPVRERKIASELVQLRAQYDGLRLKHREMERNHAIAQNEHRRIQQSLQAAVMSEVNKAAQRSKVLKMRIRELEEQNLKLQEDQRRKSLPRDHPPEKDVQIDFHSKTPVLATSPTAPLKRNTTFSSKPIPQASSHTFPAKIRIDVGEKGFIPMDHKSRGVAFVSSLFSASLSALVALIAWHAKDPCSPLVIALFIVVGMSCVNVVRFVSKVSHLFGLDAIVLVSFNSFILGTLVTPFLPLFVPRIMHIWWWSLGWLGLKPQIGHGNV